MKIAIGADHRGFAHKEYIKANMGKDFDITWIDAGCWSDTMRTDYPEYAILVANMMLTGQADYGLLLCATGVGMAITANRFAGIYAALVWSIDVARLSRQDDNSNILVIPADFVSAELAVEMTTAWLRAEFLEGRYRQRIAMIDEL